MYTAVSRKKVLERVGALTAIRAGWVQSKEHLGVCTIYYSLKLYRISTMYKKAYVGDIPLLKHGQGLYE